MTVCLPRCNARVIQASDVELLQAVEGKKLKDNESCARLGEPLTMFLLKESPGVTPPMEKLAADIVKYVIVQRGLIPRARDSPKGSSHRL